MKKMRVKIGKEIVEIEKKVFEGLLDSSPMKEYKSYKDAVETSEIALDALKALAMRAGIPYPLFFAPWDVAAFQIADKDEKLFQKIPTKNEIRLGTRGKVHIKDIELIVLDLGRKQEFLKNRVLTQANPNTYIGSLGKLVKHNTSFEHLAEKIREYFSLNLEYLRTVPKTRVLAHLCNCFESKGILISFSSYNYMPQNLDPELELSGICIKDKKFPYIFINTRDGDEKPKIIESTGRQIFTLLSMIASIGIGHFVLSTKDRKTSGSVSKLVYAIAGEVIIPRKDLNGVAISTLDELREKAHYFRVTPSMLLYRLKEFRKIPVQQARQFQIQLKAEAKQAQPIHPHPPAPTTAYGKYNGERFSKEVIRAYQKGAISEIDMKHILFRRTRKMDGSLIADYQRKYR